MEKVRLDGVVLECETRGVGEPVVLIHGAFIADAFLPLAREDALSHEYRVISYRRRGYGESTGAGGPVSLARQAADCRRLLETLGVDRAHVVGHSYGGAVAIQLATETPDLVQTLALLEPALMVGSSGPDYRESLQKGLETYREEGAAAVVENMLRARWGEDPRASLEAVLPGAFDQAIAEAATPFEVELPALLKWSLDDDEVRAIQQPTLAVLGERSKKLSPRFVDTFEWLLEELPNAEPFVLPEAAHGLQTQNASDLVAALRDFFRRHPIDLSNK